MVSVALRWIVWAFGRSVAGASLATNEAAGKVCECWVNADGGDCMFLSGWHT